MSQDTEAFWNELLTFIEARSVVPVIGPDLAIVECEGRREPFDRFLARQLALRLGLADLGDSPSLDKVVCSYLALPGARRQAVYREFGDLASKVSVGLPEPFLQLARIRDFNLFATFCTDGLLAQALNKERFGGRMETRELAFTPNEPNDLPVGTIDAALVYGLFGRVSVIPKYVLAEEDQLEWITALQVPDRRPERLFDELSKSHLLFLGCTFPDWLARFVLRTTKNRKLSSERGFSEYLVDAKATDREPLVTFLRSFSRETQVLAEDAVTFAAELCVRWLERRGANVESAREPGLLPETMPTGSVFLSYASEDRPAALRLASDLMDAGVPVWLDRQQLDWGSDYAARIQGAIQRCALFVPVLSRNAERRTGFVRKEWGWAGDRNLEFTGTSLTFLFPIVVDDAPVFTSSEIPAVFKTRHIETAPAGALRPSQIEVILAAYRAMRERAKDPQ